ncbi:hypothetical protein BGZ65_004882 [Modicella reniformis]|uniref:Uncharacterized protein n=1 Tax=Modicella reniformis TaxID=1440133 RepID=A0A9P6LSM9_9FUNG|nr:hypothetical protein BGZ65_004882 [Modicella reniformis]
MDTHSPDHNHISFDRRFATLVQKLFVGQEGQPPLLSPKSALVIMADHGLHYGPKTYSFSGFIHHKIPPLFIALPNQILNTRPNFVETLEQNQNRILSHLDLHQTLIHLAYGDMPVEGESTKDYTDFMTRFIANGTFRQQFHPEAPNQVSSAQVHGRSLLLPIEENRSCRTAWIPHDYCAFQPFLNLDPTKTLDVTFLRGALILLSNRMNELTRIFHVDDVCRPTSLILQPPSPAPKEETEKEKGDTSLVNGTFEDIGTEDLVTKAAFASATPSRTSEQTDSDDSDNDNNNNNYYETRVFYFMVRDRHQPNRKYSVTMREDEVVMGRADSIRFNR